VLDLLVDINSVFIILQQRGCLLESPSTCWKVHIPPHFIFSTYKHVFGTHPLRQVGEYPHTTQIIIHKRQCVLFHHYVI